MTKKENAIEKAVLAAIGGRWRGVCLAVPLLGLLGGCASNGGMRVTFDEDLDDLVAGMERPAAKTVEAAPQAREEAAPVASEPVEDEVLAESEEQTPRPAKAGSYVVFGKRYYIDATSEGYVAQGHASWYGRKFHGRPTANGERYDMHGFTAAHKSLPLPTYAEVTNLVNGRTVLVKVNDRGPFVGDRVIDLSFAAAKELRMVEAGVAMVEVRALDPDETAIDENLFLAENRRPKASEAPEAVAEAGEAGPANGDGEVQLAAAAAADAEAGSEIAAAVADAEDTGRAVVGAEPMLAAAAPQAEAATPRSGGKLYVKAGEFGNRDSAERLRRRLLDHLAEQVQVQESDAFLSRYAVQVGPLATPAQAEDVAEQLVALGVKGAGTSLE